MLLSFDRAMFSPFKTFFPFSLYTAYITAITNSHPAFSPRPKSLLLQEWFFAICTGRMEVLLIVALQAH